MTSPEEPQEMQSVRLIDHYWSVYRDLLDEYVREKTPKNWIAAKCIWDRIEKLK